MFGVMPFRLSENNRPTAGVFGFWNRTGTLITPATAGDSLSVPGGGANSQKFGPSTAANGANTTVVGANANAGSYLNCTIVGRSSTAGANNAAVFGYANTNAGDGAVLIGSSIVGGAHTGAISFGTNAPAAANTVTFGEAGASYYVSAVTFPNRGVTLKLPSANTLQLASGDAFIPEDATGQALGSGANNWDFFGRNLYLYSGQFQIRTPGNSYIHGTTSSLRFNFSTQITFASTDSAGVDVGLARSAAGIVKITDGSSGFGSVNAGGVLVARVSPAQITADQNDYALNATATLIRLNTDASRTITGFNATGNNGRLVMIINVGANDLVLANENAGSSAANRIITGTGADLTLTAGQSCWLIYDETSTRWRVRQ